MLDPRAAGCPRRHRRIDWGGRDATPFRESLRRPPDHAETPLPTEEFDDRLLRVQAAMERDRVDLFYAWMLRPRLPVAGLLDAVHAHCAEHDLLDHLYWSGGCELGIAFPPDWVGAYIYDRGHVAEGDVFGPMTVVNHECNFYGPEATGLSATSDTLMFYEDRAALASAVPRRLEALST